MVVNCQDIRFIYNKYLIRQCKSHTTYLLILMRDIFITETKTKKEIGPRSARTRVRAKLISHHETRITVIKLHWTGSRPRGYAIEKLRPIKKMPINPIMNCRIII